MALVAKELRINRMAISIGKLMENFNVDPMEKGLLDTPTRVAKFYESFNQPFNPSELLKAQFDDDDVYPTDDHGIVIQQHIPFVGLCEHHLLPFTGEATIVYIPKKRVVGLSKLTRLVHSYGRMRPSIQERLTNQIADTLVDELDCLGVMVIIEAEHTCMTIRGAQAPGVKTKTSVVRGVFKDVPQARQEALALLD